MKYELVSYLFIIAVLLAYRTVLSGRKNGCFYHKNDNPLPPFLEREIKNIHFLETPAWYALSAVAFFAILSVERALFTSYYWFDMLIQVAIALVYMSGVYWMPSYHFQRGITAGLKDDDHLDAIDESEVAIMIFGKKIQFWKGRLFNNRRRKLAQWLGVIQTVAAIALLIWFNLILN